VPFDFDEIRQLLITIAQTDIAEVTLKSDDFELTVRKGISGSHQTLPVVEPRLGSVSGITSTSVAAAHAAPGTSLEAMSNRVIDPTLTAVVQHPVPTPLAIDLGLVEVVSPMVGTFYRAPAPGEPSFVEVGDRIRTGQTVCIIEAMKLMNEIETEVAGQVMEILLQNGEPVEFGQPLLRVKPDS
jgi:acetyl-CoA carboxylase biotin carboxyl carrier protein